MFPRYYYNWEHGCPGQDEKLERQNKSAGIGMVLLLLDALIILFSPINWALACLLEPLSGAVNPLIKVFRPVVELGLRAGIKMEPLFNPLSRWMIDSVKQAEPTMFVSGSSERSRGRPHIDRVSPS